MKHFITLSLLLTLSINLWGQDTWVKTFGGKGGEVKGGSIISTSDGDFLIAGTFYCPNGDFKGMDKGGGNDVFVIKLDKSGNQVWKRTFGGSDTDEGYCITATSDDGVLITGGTSSNDGDFKGMYKGGIDVFVIHLDKDGNVLWKKSFGGSDSDMGYSITTASDGSILITGGTSSNDGDFEEMSKSEEDIFVINLDKRGNLVWKKIFGGSKSEYGNSITAGSDGGVLITGGTSSNDGDFAGMILDVSNDEEIEETESTFIVELDKDGNLVWKKCFDGSGIYRGYSMATTSDSGVVISGTTKSEDGDYFMGNDEVSFFVIKLDKDGNELWKEVSGGLHMYSSDIRVTPDDGIVIVGTVAEPIVLVDDNTGNSQGSSVDDIILCKLNSEGEKLWERSFGGKGNREGGASVTTTLDGNIVITGLTDSNDGDFKSMNKGALDVFVMKLDSNGNLKPSGKKKSKKK